MDLGETIAVSLRQSTGENRWARAATPSAAPSKRRAWAAPKRCRPAGQWPLSLLWSRQPSEPRACRKRERPRGGCRRAHYGLSHFAKLSGLVIRVKHGCIAAQRYPAPVEW